MKKTIETENLYLIACDMEILQAAVEGNEQLENLLGVNVPDNWTEFGKGALMYSLDKLSVDKDEINWRTYFPIHKADNKLIGSGGYKGKPTEDGIVELGYEIAPGYRNKGLATEMTKALISNAFSFRKVNRVIAHTPGETNESTKVLTKCGFEKSDEIDDPEEGLIWKWELLKSDYYG